MNINQYETNHYLITEYFDDYDSVFEVFNKTSEVLDLKLFKQEQEIIFMLDRCEFFVDFSTNESIEKYLTKVINTKNEINYIKQLLSKSKNNID